MTRRTPDFMAAITAQRQPDSARGSGVIARWCPPPSHSAAARAGRGQRRCTGLCRRRWFYRRGLAPRSSAGSASEPMDMGGGDGWDRTVVGVDRRNVRRMWPRRAPAWSVDCGGPTCGGRNHRRWALACRVDGGPAQQGGRDHCWRAPTWGMDSGGGPAPHQLHLSPTWSIIWYLASITWHFTQII